MSPLNNDTNPIIECDREFTWIRSKLDFLQVLVLCPHDFVFIL